MSARLPTFRNINDNSGRDTNIGSGSRSANTSRNKNSTSGKSKTKSAKSAMDHHVPEATDSGGGSSDSESDHSSQSSPQNRRRIRKTTSSEYRKRKRNHAPSPNATHASITIDYEDDDDDDDENNTNNDSYHGANGNGKRVTSNNNNNNNSNTGGKNNKNKNGDNNESTGSTSNTKSNSTRRNSANATADDSSHNPLRQKRGRDRNEGRNGDSDGDSEAGLSETEKADRRASKTMRRTYGNVTSDSEGSVSAHSDHDSADASGSDRADDNGDYASDGGYDYDDSYNNNNNNNARNERRYRATNGNAAWNDVRNITNAFNEAASHQWISDGGNRQKMMDIILRNLERIGADASNEAAWRRALIDERNRFDQMIRHYDQTVKNAIPIISNEERLRVMKMGVLLSRRVAAGAEFMTAFSKYSSPIDLARLEDGDTYRIISKHKDFKEVHSVILHCLKIAAQVPCRKLGEYLYIEKSIDAAEDIGARAKSWKNGMGTMADPNANGVNHATHAPRMRKTGCWERWMKISEFVEVCCRKEDYPIQWMEFMKCRAETITHHLQHGSDSEIPVLKVSDTIWSCPLGKYVASRGIFLPFAEDEEPGACDDYESAARVVAAARIQRNKDSRNYEAAVLEASTFGSCKFIDADFPYEFAGLRIDSDWYHDSPTPAFQRILEYQRMSRPWHMILEDDRIKRLAAATEGRYLKTKEIIDMADSDDGNGNDDDDGSDYGDRGRNERRRRRRRNRGSSRREGDDRRRRPEKVKPREHLRIKKPEKRPERYEIALLLRGSEDQPNGADGRSFSLNNIPEDAFHIEGIDKLDARYHRDPPNGVFDDVMLEEAGLDDEARRIALRLPKDTPNPRRLTERERALIRYEREQVIRQVYVQIGRLAYPIGLLDDLQLSMFFHGVAQTGKSTLGMTILDLFAKETTRILSSSGEKTFGLDGFENCRAYGCLEVKKNLSLPQSMMQSMISGDRVSLPLKFRTAIDMPWTAPGFYMGNEFGAWEDLSGSATRRFIVWFLDRHVSERAVDGTLKSQLAAQLGFLLCKSIRAYSEFVSAGYGTKHILQSVSPYFRWSQQRMRNALNESVAFIHSTHFEIHPSRYATLSDIRAIAATERKQLPDLRRAIEFMCGQDIGIDASMRQRPYRGRLVSNEEFVIGIGLRVNPQPDQPVRDYIDAVARVTASNEQESAHTARMTQEARDRYGVSGNMQAPPAPQPPAPPSSSSSSSSSIRTNQGRRNNDDGSNGSNSNSNNNNNSVNSGNPSAGTRNNTGRRGDANNGENDTSNNNNNKGRNKRPIGNDAASRDPRNGSNDPKRRRIDDTVDHRDSVLDGDASAPAHPASAFYGGSSASAANAVAAAAIVRARIDAEASSAARVGGSLETTLLNFTAHSQTSTAGPSSSAVTSSSSSSSSSSSLDTT